MTPEEAWSGRKPNLAHLKVFGCLAMVHVPSGQRKKSELKSNEQFFVGKKIDVTRDVKFSESRSRFLSCHWSKEESTNPPLNPDIGEEAKRKERLVDKGYSPLQSIVYEDTFASTLAIFSCAILRHWQRSTISKIVEDVENGTLSIEQQQYMEEKWSVQNGVKTSLVHLTRIYDANSEAVGCLVYLSRSCLSDICHSVGIVSHFSNNPGKTHWTAVKRIFRYLKYTKGRVQAD
ncbi:Retrovirus-related Pol polyprotein from transposon TNT 1-94 [Trichinella pseudospiralis]|uniref:Retrovirus-related Pol polyprotein from transposon TNT 1-94 n=1 Tax=Trichinella pseudospiralis TaxID=6337 RepID=A0A0V0YHZ2_TRIPS|nr:Retrovirus-related Pol polyprotein from transposon TNT 1-94 [Trichinella pseudospiralis]